MSWQRAEYDSAAFQLALKAARRNLADTPLPEMALRLVMQTKVRAANAIHQLDTIDCFTDDWDTEEDAALRSAALDMHLHCQYAAEECNAIVEIVSAIINGQADSSQMEIFTELEVRRENAADEVEKLAHAIEQLGKTQRDPALSLQEMHRRTERVFAQLQGLKAKVEELEKLARTPVPSQDDEAAAK